MGQSSGPMPALARDDALGQAIGQCAIPKTCHVDGAMVVAPMAGQGEDKD
jgi:hypothetical protein